MWSIALAGTLLIEGTAGVHRQVHDDVVAEN